jgi:phosphoglycolate phosphatase
MYEQVKAVIFDHDDTLVSSREAKWTHNRHVAKVSYGLDLSDEELLLHWGKPFPEMLKLLFNTDDAEQARLNVLAFAQDYPKKLYDETIPTLKHLYTHGKTLGIVSATMRNSLEHELDLFGLPRDMISYTQTAEESDFHKPDPRVFIPTSEWLYSNGIRPHEVLYVGDGLHDEAAAHGAGYNFLGVETGLINRAQFRTLGILSISGIADLRKHF